MGCHVLLQGIFLTQGLNSRLLRPLHCRGIHTEPVGSPGLVREDPNRANYQKIQEAAEGQGLFGGDCSVQQRSHTDRWVSSEKLGSSPGHSTWHWIVLYKVRNILVLFQFCFSLMQILVTPFLYSHFCNHEKDAWLFSVGFGSCVSFRATVRGGGGKSRIWSPNGKEETLNKVYVWHWEKWHLKCLTIGIAQALTKLSRYDKELLFFFTLASLAILLTFPVGSSARDLMQDEGGKKRWFTT